MTKQYHEIYTPWTLELCHLESVLKDSKEFVGDFECRGIILFEGMSFYEMTEVMPASFFFYHPIASDLIVMVDHKDLRGWTKAELLTYLRSNKKDNEATVFGVVKYGFLACTVSPFCISPPP